MSRSAVIFTSRHSASSAVRFLIAQSCSRWPADNRALNSRLHAQVSARSDQPPAAGAAAGRRVVGRPATPRSPSGRAPDQIAELLPTSLSVVLTPSVRQSRRRWRASFCRLALRRDSSRRCCKTCSGWFAPQRSGSSDSRSVSPAPKCSNTSRR